MSAHPMGTRFPFHHAPSIAQQVCLPLPRLLTVMPMGGQVGTNLEVTITGEKMDDSGELLFSSTKITAKPKVAADVVANDGAGLIGHDGSTLIGHDGSTLLGKGGAGVVANDGAGLVGQDGASIVAGGGLNATQVGNGNN